jgi:hypothetical protein
LRVSLTVKINFTDSSERSSAVAAARDYLLPCIDSLSVLPDVIHGIDGDDSALRTDQRPDGRQS